VLLLLLLLLLLPQTLPQTLPLQQGAHIRSWALRGLKPAGPACPWA
jgi:hypothetical protein